MPSRAEIVLSARVLVEAAPDAMVVVDPRGEIVVANAQAEKVFGYTRAQLIGKSVEELIPPSHRVLHSHHREGFFGSPEVRPMGVGLKLFGLRNDGTEIPVDVSLSPLVVESGTFVIAAIRDVTEHRGMEAALHETEERFRLAMNNVASGVYTLDLQGLVTYVNPAAETMFGRTNAQLLGKKMHDLTHYKHPDGTPFPASECPGLQVLQKGVELREHEDMFIRKDGSFFPVVYSASPLKRDAQTVGIVVGFRDDTLRREAERAVRKSEEQFRLVANTAPVMIWMSDVDGLCTYCNQPALEFSGTPLEAALGRGWAENLHPEDVGRSWDTFRQALDRREPFQIEHRLRRHDGQYRWILASGVPRFKADGSFAGYIGSAIDVTERKQAEETLQSSEERFRLAAQAGKMYAFEWDAVTNVIVRSGDPAQIVGGDGLMHASSQQVWTQVHPEDRERLRAAAANLSPEKPYLRIGHRMVRQDGEVIWVERNALAYFDEQGEMLRMVGMVADVTERKRTEEALRQKDKELSEAQRLAVVGSWHWDARKDEVTWSEELYRIVGLDPTLPALSYKDAPRILTSESLERLHRAVEEALRHGTLYDLDLEVFRPDGVTRWLRLRGETVGDTTGAVVRLRGTAQDITERKLADEAIASMSRKLLEAQEQERARIARELHDDVNQRLALLSVEIQRMKDVSPVTYGDLRSRMDELGKRTSEISDVVQSLSHELHSSKLEYLGLVSAMKGFCKEFGGKHKVEIDFNSEGIPSGVPSEVSLCLFRVMQEGLQNALKHSGVKLFEVKLLGSPTEIRLTVRDLGKGFEPELAKDTPGLGLISMRERVRLAKGAISITSRPQSGTEIDVYVPLQAGARTAQAKLAGA